MSVGLITVVSVGLITVVSVGLITVVSVGSITVVSTGEHACQPLIKVFLDPEDRLAIINVEGFQKMQCVWG